MAGGDKERFRLRPAAPKPRTPPTPGPSLAEELEGVALDALVGASADASAVGRVLTAVRAALLRRGLGQARVQADLVGTGVRVQIDLPPGPARVRQLILEVS